MQMPPPVQALFPMKRQPISRGLLPASLIMPPPDRVKDAMDPPSRRADAAEPPFKVKVQFRRVGWLASRLAMPFPPAGS